jgi:uncharacterized membrane protein YraQ (UPF0718 family)
MKFKQFARDNWPIVLVLIALLVVISRRFDKVGETLSIGFKAMWDITAILLPIFLFIGFFSAWMDEKRLVRMFGGKVTIREFFYASVVGTSWVGPLASLMPLLKTMLDKGASTAVVATILATFAIKVPFIPLEIKLLGWQFTALHNGLMLAAAPLVGLIMQRVSVRK